MKVYASIHIGSYGISLKVFEIVKSKHIRQIDEVRRHIRLSRDILLYKGFSRENLLLLVETLREMKEIINSYKTDSYDAYIGFALAPAENLWTLIDQAALQANVELKLLDNSRQRFIVYKALCSIENFDKLVQERTVIVDVSGTGIQFTVFFEGRLLEPQHIYFGATNVWDNLRKLRQSADYREQLLQMIYTDIESFYYTFLENIPPKKLIILNNPISSISRARSRKKDGFFSTGEYLKILKKTMKGNMYYVTEEGMGEDYGDVRLSFLLLYRAVLEKIPAEEVYVPPISLHEGMVYEYALEHKLIKSPRNFEEDVYSSSWEIARRYNCFPKHIETLKNLSCQLYDSIQKRHGLSERHRLLLNVAVILHDTGKYISMSDEAKCTYTIITSSEILGLSQKEQEMIGWLCYSYKVGVPEYERLSAGFSRDEYFVIKKLYAIMCLAGALDRSHMQKFKTIRFRFNGRDELSVTIDTQDSLALEADRFEERAVFFEDIFAIRPVLHTVRNEKG